MICIRNGLLVLPNGVREADLYIRDTKIFSVGGHWAGAEEIDASGCYVFPGFIDPRCAFALDAERNKLADDFANGTEASLLGGTTTVVTDAVSKKGSLPPEALDTWETMAGDRSAADYTFRIGVTDTSRPALTMLSRLNTMGFAAFSASLSDAPGGLSLAELKTLLEKCGSDSLLSVSCAPLSAKDASLSSSEEAAALRSYLRLAEESRSVAWVSRVSCAASLEEIRAARKRGLRVVAETSLPYLTLHGNEKGTPRLSPPLRTEEDAAALLAAVESDEIDLVSSDHIAADGEGENACGAAGAEYRNALILEQVFRTGRLTPNAAARLLSEMPARCLGLYPRKGVIKTGADADLTIWDPSWEGTAGKNEGHSRAALCPWEGRPLYGRPRAVFLRGLLVLNRGVILRYGQGRLMRCEALSESSTAP